MIYKEDGNEGIWTFRTRSCGCCSSYYQFYENPTAEDEWNDNMTIAHVVEYMTELEQQTKLANELLKRMEAKAERQLQQIYPAGDSQ